MKTIIAFLVVTVMLPASAFAGAAEYTAAANKCLKDKGVYVAPGASGSGCYARPNGGKMHCTDQTAALYAAAKACDAAAQTAAR